MLAWTPAGFASAAVYGGEGGGPPRDTILRRLRAEFMEMAGLSLTVPQAERLCGAPGLDCAWALEQLAAEGVVRRTSGGAFVRA